MCKTWFNVPASKISLMFRLFKILKNYPFFYPPVKIQELVSLTAFYKLIPHFLLHSHDIEKKVYIMKQ